MSASGTPSAALVPARITRKGNRANINPRAFWSTQIAYKYTVCIYPDTVLTVVKHQNVPTIRVSKTQAKSAEYVLFTVGVL
jgi:hypothetical protein